MFDDLNKQTQLPSAKEAAPATQPNNNIPRPPVEDMFAGVDETVKSEALQAKPSSAPLADGGLNNQLAVDQGYNSKKLLILGLLILGLGFVFGSGYYVYANFFKNGLFNLKKTAPAIDSRADIKANPAPDAVEIPAGNNALAPPADNGNQAEAPASGTTQPPDSDQDGLSDEEEISLGTNVNAPDSDDDGLSDREEVKVYSTDPLKADTDGDSYPDGTEIKNGYSPKGPGKLYEINK